MMMNLKELISYIKSKYPENISTIELQGVQHHLIVESSVAKMQIGRRSKPGDVVIKQHKKSPNKNYPSERTWQLAGVVMEQISKNFPNIITNQNLPKKIEDGAHTIHRLTKKYDFKLIRDVLLWAVRDSFWKRQVRSISGIVQVSKTNGNTKFENIAMAYQNSTKSDIDELADELENIVSDHYRADATAEQVLNDLVWFQDELEDMCLTLTRQNRFYWHLDLRLVPVARWLVELDFKIIPQKDIKNFRSLMKRYLEFLGYRLQKEDIKTLFAGMFSNKSALFTHFINDLSDQWGSEILQES